MAAHGSSGTLDPSLMGPAPAPLDPAVLMGPAVLMDPVMASWGSDGSGSHPATADLIGIANGDKGTISNPRTRAVTVPGL